MNLPDHECCIWLAVLSSALSVYGCVCIFACILNLSDRKRKGPR